MTEQEKASERAMRLAAETRRRQPLVIQVAQTFGTLGNQSRNDDNVHLLREAIEADDQGALDQLDRAVQIAVQQAAMRFVKSRGLDRS